jgi:hypothetical protein
LLSGRISTAALVRVVDADRPTLLIDESDAAFKGETDYAEALRGVLNTGFRRSGSYTMCVGQGANQTPRRFSTFGPKVIAGIGELPDTVADRSIRIELRRRTKAELVEKFRQRDVESVAKPLCDELSTWANHAIPSLAAARPQQPPELNDRAEDICEPLLAIAEQAGVEWQRRAQRAIVSLVGGERNDDDIAIELLHDIEQAFRRDEVFLASRELVKRLTDLEDRPWADWRNGNPITQRAFADRLRPFGIVPSPNGKVRGYHLDQFADAWSRYPSGKPSNRQPPNENAGESRTSTRQSADASAGAGDANTPTNTDAPDALTLPDQDQGSHNGTSGRRY